MVRIKRILAIIMLFILISSLQGVIMANASQQPLSESENLAIQALNNDRRQHCLNPLKPNITLAEVARRHAIDMMERDYFAHKSPEGIDPFQRIKKAGIRYKAAGENIYKGLYDPIGEDIYIAQQFLMTSPNHRRNILDSDFTEIGIGIVRSEDGWMYLVQCFIKP